MTMKAKETAAKPDTYRTYLCDRPFAFGDPVELTMVHLPLKERTGRLVQVRQGCGQFGSDTLFVRRRDGSLHSFENVGLKHYDEEELPELEQDSPETEYTFKGEWPETGFIVDAPKQPETPGSFAMTITTARNDES